MNYRRHAIIMAVIDALQERGSWTGKTHVQKALTLLRDSGKVQVPFTFVLYKHGPYSFEIEEELEQLQSYGAIEIEPNIEGYGVTLFAGDMADFPAEQSPLSEPEQKAIQDVCSFVGSRNVTELERLATASWITTRERLSTPHEVARRLNRLKPHVSIADAERAYLEVSNWLRGARLTTG